MVKLTKLLEGKGQQLSEEPFNAAENVSKNYWTFSDMKLFLNSRVSYKIHMKFRLYEWQ